MKYTSFPVSFQYLSARPHRLFWKVAGRSIFESRMDGRTRSEKTYSLSRISKRNSERTNIYLTFHCFVADVLFFRD